MKYHAIIKTLLGGLLLLSIQLAPLVAGEQEIPPLSVAEQNAVLDSVTTRLNASYIYPETAARMEERLRQQQKAGTYAVLTHPAEFAQAVSADLLAISQDRHLGMRFNPELVDMMRRDDAAGNELLQAEQELAELRQSNFGFEELKILEGNIGYLKFNQFAPAELGGSKAVAAMEWLSNTNAIIFDLRENGGGSPSMIQLITTYLFDEDIKHLNSFYWREENKTVQFWTLPWAPGSRRPDVDVYVLTSGYTFSGAEEFTYNLKNMERATIVGETTGGGAHPVDTEPIGSWFVLRIPKGKAINPITGTNWEGTGVEPDVTVPAAEALLQAHLLAVEKLLKCSSDPALKVGLEWAALGLQGKLNPVMVDRKVLKSYQGSYGPRTITLEKGELFYQRGENPPMRMIPLTETIFRFDETDYFRLEIVIEHGKAAGVRGLYDNGTTDGHKRS